MRDESANLKLSYCKLLKTMMLILIMQTFCPKWHCMVKYSMMFEIHDFLENKLVALGGLAAGELWVSIEPAAKKLIVNDISQPWHHHTYFVSVAIKGLWKGAIRKAQMMLVK
jgi:hypothetical protein